MVILPSSIFYSGSNPIPLLSTFYRINFMFPFGIPYVVTFYSSGFGFFCNFLLSHSSICQYFKENSFCFPTFLPSAVSIKKFISGTDILFSQSIQSHYFFIQSECIGRSFRCKRTLRMTIPLFTSGSSFTRPTIRTLLAAA